MKIQVLGALIGVCCASAANAITYDFNEGFDGFTFAFVENPGLGHNGGNLGFVGLDVFCWLCRTDGLA